MSLNSQCRREQLFNNPAVVLFDHLARLVYRMCRAVYLSPSERS